jgi:hypothetical protein
VDILPPDATELVWRKSTYSGSGDQCVEVAVRSNARRSLRHSNQDGSRFQWRKSTRSANGSECVEAALVGNDSKEGVQAPSVLLRDSKNPSGPILSVTSVQWRAFIGGVKEGWLT